MPMPQASRNKPKSVMSTRDRGSCRRARSVWERGVNARAAIHHGRPKPNHQLDRRGRRRWQRQPFHARQLGQRIPYSAGFNAVVSTLTGGMPYTIIVLVGADDGVAQGVVDGSCNLGSRNLWITREFFAVIRSRKMAPVIRQVCAYERWHSRQVTLHDCQRKYPGDNFCWTARPERFACLL
jgi:hypothetical protein